MKRLTGLLLLLALVFTLSAALADRQPCETGGFSVKLPDHFVEEPGYYGSDLCFYWHGNKLTVLAYVSYQGEVSETFEVLTGEETDSRPVTVNGMKMLYTRSETPSGISITYIYTFLYSGKGILVFRTDNTELARQTIAENNLPFIAEDALSQQA